MKNMILLVILSIIFTNCQETSENNDLKKKLDDLTNNDKYLSTRLDSIEKIYVKPYKIFEEAVINESGRKPDSIIFYYMKIIKAYPNSYWSHEAKRRIQNVEKRRKLWSEENGWELLKVTPVKDIETISCPGC